MNIHASSANSNARIATSRENKKQQTTKQPISICQPETSLIKELQSLNRLKMAPSTVRCPKGTGSGLFSTNKVELCKTPGKQIFNKGDIILEGITGILTFCHQCPETGKFLEWLYYDGLCMPLSNDSHILWSPYSVNDLSLGVMPDGPVIYMNDSITPNCKVNVGVKRKFEESEALNTLKRFPSGEVPIEFKVEAAKEIPPDTELLWCYRPEAKRTRKSGKSTSSVNYQARYLKKDLTDTDYQQIKNTTTSAFSDPVSVTITTDFSDIRERRLTNLETPIKRVLKYSPEESEIIRHLPGNTRKTSNLLNESITDPLKLRTYVKYQLNHCNPVAVAIKNIRSSCKRHEIQVPNTHPNNNKDSYSWHSYQIYDYCYNNDLVSPEDDVISIPMEWLGKQIEQDNKNPRWLTLLKTILRINLLKTKDIRKLRQQLNQQHIPNPLRDHDKSWTSEEIERFAGTGKLTQHLATPETLNIYHSCKERVTYKAAQKLHEAALKGDLQAQKAIISKRVSAKRRISGFLRDTRKSKESIHFLVNGVYSEPDQSTVLKFVRQHFNKDQKKDMLGYHEYTDQDLLDSLKNKKKFKTSAIVEIYRRIRSKNNTRLLKQYISERFKNTKYPSRILYNLNRAGIKYKGESPFTLDHLRQLFEPGENDTIEKFFERTTTTEELFERLLNEGLFIRRIQLQLLQRCKDSREVTLRYIKVCRQLSKHSPHHFYQERAALLNKHKIPTFTEGLPYWSYRAIKKIINSDTSTTPKRKTTTKKTEPTTLSDDTPIENAKSMQYPEQAERRLTASPTFSTARVDSTGIYQRPVVKKYWPREKWCGQKWWSSSSKLANFAGNHKFNSIQELKKASPTLYRWLERMNQSLIKAKTNKAARALYPDEFKGTVLTNPHINTMVGWINDSLNKMGLAKLQELPFQQNIEVQKIADG